MWKICCCCAVAPERLRPQVSKSRETAGTRSSERTSASSQWGVGWPSTLSLSVRESEKERCKREREREGFRSVSQQPHVQHGGQLHGYSGNSYGTGRSTLHGQAHAAGTYNSTCVIGRGSPGKLHTGLGRVRAGGREMAGKVMLDRSDNSLAVSPVSPVTKILVTRQTRS